MISLEMIETFLSLLQTENFNKTADKLNTTQSTVSSRIKKMEQFLGVSLFKRGKFGTIATSQGILFKPHAVKMLKNWQEAIDFLNIEGLYSDTLNIGIQFSVANSIIDRIIEKAEQKLPMVALYMESNYATTMIHLLRNREIELALMYRLDSNVTGYEIEDIGVERFVMVSYNIDCDYQVEKHIFVNWSNGFRNSYANAVVRVTQRSVSFSTADIALPYLKKHGGTIYVPEHYLGREDMAGLNVVKGAPIITQDVVALYHTHSRLKKECGVMAKVLKDVFWGMKSTFE